MNLIFGVIFIFVCVLGSFSIHGKVSVLWQPLEFVIIFGAAMGAYVIANSKDSIFDTFKFFKKLFKQKPYNKKAYLELLCFLFNVFKLMKTKGLLELESHIENPHDSDLFKKYPSFHHNHHNVEFFCDYIRMITMGVDNHYQIEDLMDKEIELHHHEGHGITHALTNFADGMPALGIVAAVLGVITTMQSISEPPEILGGLIGAALVGTFAGVLLSYGIFAPMAQYLTKYCELETQYLNCIKAGILSHMQGNAPAVTVEFVRKQVPSHDRPGFKELEEALQKTD